MLYNMDNNIKNKPRTFPESSVVLQQDKIHQSSPRDIASLRKVRGKVAWRIYFVWLFKRIIPLFILEIVFLVLVFYFLGKLVFVQSVFENAFLSSVQNPILVASYMFKAFLNTSIIKKIIVMGLLGFGVLLMRDMGRAIASYISTSRVAKR